MFATLSDRNRLDEVHESCMVNDSQKSLNPFELPSFRMEYVREWGPCILGIDQAVRGPLSGIGPAVFCGSVIPCGHEMQLESQGIGCCFASSLSGNDQMKMSQMVQNDPYIAWLLKVIPSEAADGARCSMGVLEHTTAAWIIKEAITLGVDVRGIRVCASCDSGRFRQFLYEAFPMIEDISVYSKFSSSSSVSCCNTITTNPTPPASVTPYTTMLPSSPQSLPSSPSSPMSVSSIVPPAVCVAGVVAQFSRDHLSRQLLYRQRQSPSPPSRSPLSKPVNTFNSRCRRERLTSSANGSFFTGSLFRNRYSSSAEDLPNVRCAAFAGNEFGEAHCGLVPEVSHNTFPHSSSSPIEMYDFYGEDEESVMNGLTSPKRMRVVPCSPPLSTVIVSEDSLPSVSHSSSGHNFTNSSPRSHHVDHFDSIPFSSTSLLVSPPPSTSAPVYRPIYGQFTNPF